jgi:hypothetical protein
MSGQPSGVAVEEEHFESLLDQVRELHRLADKLTRSPRLNEHVRARLSWTDPPTLPTEQRELADEVVEALSTPRLTPSQLHRLQRAFFGR